VGSSPTLPIFHSEVAELVYAAFSNNAGMAMWVRVPSSVLLAQSRSGSGDLYCHQAWRTGGGSLTVEPLRAREKVQVRLLFSALFRERRLET
jgi:hypothetical protein